VTRKRRIARFCLSTALGTYIAVAAAPLLAQSGPASGTLPDLANAGGTTVMNNPTTRTMVVDMNGANRRIIDWNSFDIASDSRVEFNAPNGQAIVLNRINSATASQIYGTVESNGQVWLINPNGMIFGSSARVNVGGLVASTLGLTDTDTNFRDSSDLTYGFSGAGNAAISVQGGAQILAGGSIALIAPGLNILSGATINAGRDALLGSANSATLTFTPNGTDDLDVFSFLYDGTTPGSATALSPVINGSITAGQIYAVVLPRSSAGATINLGGVLVANGARTDGRGGIILSNDGGGISAPGQLGTPGLTQPYAAGGISAAAASLRAPSLSVAASELIASGANSIQAFDVLPLDSFTFRNNAATGTVTINAFDGTSFSYEGTSSRADFAADITASGSIFARAGNGISGANFRANTASGTGNLQLTSTRGDITVSGTAQSGGSGTEGLVSIITGTSAAGNISVGTVSGNSVRLDAHSDSVTVDSALTVRGGRYDLIASSAGGRTLFPQFNGTAQTFAIENTGTNLFTIDALSFDGTLSLAGSSASYALNDIDAQSITTSPIQSLAFVGDVDASTISGNAANAISQTGGTITADSLSLTTGATTGTGIALTGENSVGTASFAAATGSAATVAFNQAGNRALVVNSTADNGGVNITADTGLVTLNSVLSGGNVSVVSDGAINTTSANVAGALSLDGQGTVNLGGTVTAQSVNATSRSSNVAAPGTVTASGDISILANDTIIVPGSIVATGDLAMLSVNQIVMDGGSVQGRLATLDTGAFINNTGATAVQATQRWAIYTPAPANNTYGNLDSGNTALWGSTSSTRPISGTTGNRYVFQTSPTLVVTPDNKTKTYGDAFSNFSFAAVGLHPGVTGAFLPDTAASALGSPVLSSLGGAATADVLAGGYTISFAASTVSPAGYTLDLRTGTLTVDAKALTATASALDRIYDGTTGASGSISLGGVLFGDDVTVNGATYAFANKNAGANKSVGITGATLGGVDAGNYTVTLPVSTTASILQKALTAAIAADNKTYDGTTAATGRVTGLTGVVLGDTVSTTGGSYAFADRNAGTGKAVTASGVTLTGADAGNYTVSLDTTTASILQKVLTAAIAADSKTYDGTTAATGRVTGLTGVVLGDTVSTTSGSYAFADKNAGAGKTVTASGVSLTGADAGNYTVSLDTTTASILQKVLTAAIAADSKTYDGTTAATGRVTGLTGVVLGDTVSTTGGSYAFADRNAGAGKTVTASGVTLTGADASNYTVSLDTTTASILQKLLTAAIAADNKTYDGNTAATGRVTGLTGVVLGDTVSTTGGSYAFADKNAGTGKAVTASGVTLTGADAGNYTVSLDTTTASILQKVLTAAIAADSKTYDGTTAATGRVTGLTGVVLGDTVSTTSGSYAFADKNAGAGKTVTASGVSLTGADAGNYTVSLDTTTASILQKVLTAAIAADSKTYDGTTAATGRVTGLTGVVLGDTVSTTGGSYAFADRNAGAGKTVTASGVTLTGADASNYTVSLDTTTASILQKLLTAAIAADNKTYDGNTAATGRVTGLTGVVLGDTVSTTGGSYAFADKNAGTGKAVTASGVTLTGADAGNYTVSLDTTTASILQKVLTAAIAADNKTYDGNTTATGRVTGLTGVVLGDTVSTTGGSYAFADKNAGSGKTVTASGVALTGADAGNYALNIGAAQAAANILQKALTAAIAADSKTYDGTTAATGRVTGMAGVIAGDTVSTTGGSYAFADRNAGTGKTVTASGVTLTGADAGNYTVTIDTATADILKKVLTAAIAANDKTYDGTVTADGRVTDLIGLIAGDNVSAAGGAYAFADKNAGTDKIVTVDGLTLTGDDAGNYVLDLNGRTTADILRKALTIAIDNLTKLAGSADPQLTYRIEGGTLPVGDAVSGELGRQSGEAAGQYAINAGTLAISDNYDLTFTPGILTIQAGPSAPDKEPARVSTGETAANIRDIDDVIARDGAACFQSANDRMTPTIPPEDIDRPKVPDCPAVSNFK